MADPRENVKVSVNGNVLTLMVDLTKDYGRSASGKTVIIASSKGNTEVPGHEGIRFGLNVYRK